jgi:hypothetical protein
MNLIEALQSLRPGAQWTLDGESLAGLTWNDIVQPRPSDLEIIAEMAKPSPSPWQPAPVWRQFITGLDAEGNPHDNPYARINGLANTTIPALNTALFRLALAWQEQGDQAFWQSRVSAAIANIEAMLGTGAKIAEHSAEVALFEAWNADYGLGLTFPW